MTLRLAEDLALPLDVVTEKLAWLGRTGSGKTYGAMKLAELMLAAGAQIGVIDPVGVWRALRVPATKDGQAFEVVVFGGLYGDLPLEAAAGELVADLVVDRGLSFVLDVSQFIPSEQQRFVRAFADRFFHRKKSAPSAVHLFMEECQEFIPENPSGDEARTLGVMQRLWKLGRNFGIGGSLISQRPQEIAKKALNMSGTLFAFQMTGPQERKTVRAWVADHGVSVDIESVLQKLQTGQPHVESPTFLEVSKTVRILPRVTADLSSTPKVGASTSAKRALTPIDVEQLKTSMAATIEKAKADDPRELRKRIAELERELKAKLATSNQQPAAPKTIDKPVITDTQLERVARVIAQADVTLHRTASALEKPVAAVREQLALLTKAFVAVRQPAVPLRARPPMVRSVQSPPPSNGGRVVHPHREPSPPVDGSVTPVQQRILDALVELEQLGARQPGRELVALLSDYTHLNSKGFVNALGALRSAGHIDYPWPGTVALTETGRARARASDAPRSPEDVQARICRLLGGASERILQPLIAAYPSAVRREDVAGSAGYGHLNSKGFVNALGRLHTLGFVEYPERGTVRAAPVLFLEGR